jgi:adenine-specific DNA-methyltransferase
MANNNDKYKNHSREELIDELETLKKKKYGLIWDKKNSQEMLDAFVNWENVPENFTPKQFPVLKEIKNKEIETDKSKSTNFLIEGDNYHSLAVLNFTHQNKIDVIYIDPPYNRGTNDFRFNDNYVDKEDPWRHSKWLSFMEKRLRLAYRLLKNTGVLFISIDDNEMAQLKLLCDEIFGENMVETYIWCLQDKTEGSFVKTSKNTVRKEHEYILACFKSQVKFKKYRTEKKFSEGSFSNPDNDPKGPWFSGNISRNGIKSTTGSKYFTIETPTGKKYTRNWTLSKEEYKNLLINGEIYFSKNGDGVPRQKIYQSSDSYSIQSSLFAGLHTSITGKNELKELFNGQVPFDYPKPSTLIKRLIEISEINNESIILDFFAGTGTTGHAVMNLNKSDKGKRKFILCTNNEEVDENGNKNKHKICTDVCYPRIEKVINGYKNSKGEKVAGLGGNLKYFKTDFVGSDSTDKNKRDLVNKSTEMICIKENIFDLVADGGLDYRIYQKGKKFLGVIFEIDAVADFKKEAEKHKGNFTVYCFSYTEATPEKEFKGLKNKYILKPIPAVILRIYLEIFKK